MSLRHCYNPKAAFSHPRASTSTIYSGRYIPLLKKELAAQQVSLIFVIPKDKFELIKGFSKDNCRGLPENSLFVIDDTNKLANALLKVGKLLLGSFYTIIYFVNKKKGEIAFPSMGYRIGIGESLLKQKQ